MLRVRETVVASETTDGSAFVRDEGECPVAADNVSEPSKLPVDGVLAKRRIKENVDVFREALDQVPALRQAGAAFEDDLVRSCIGDDSQRFCNVVVLLDDRRA